MVCDKNTQRSRGYGFVTFKESTAATAALHNPLKMIDGRMTEVRPICVCVLLALPVPNPVTIHVRFVSRFLS